MIRSILSWFSHLFSKQSTTSNRPLKIRQAKTPSVRVGAILLVGGFGTRLAPLTFSTPKPMLKVAGVPFTEHQILKAKAANVSEIVLATSYLSEVFKPYFGTGEKFGIEIKYSVEQTALGTGGGIKLAAMQLRECDLVVVFNGDVLSGHDLKKQIKFHQEQSADVTLYLTQVLDARAYGSVVLNKKNQVMSFNEKMENPPSNLINAGCYIFNRSVIEEITSNKVVSVERETFPELLNRGRKIFGFVDKNYWLDIGNPQALLKASTDIITGKFKSPAFDLRSSTNKNYPNALIKSGAKIDASSKIDGGTVIESDVTIAEKCQVRSSIIGTGAKIQSNCQIESSIVADFAQIPAGTIIINNYIGFSPK